jgi:fermentation-respiration switch protein FrsA (DUF1100 family)
VSQGAQHKKPEEWDMATTVEPTTKHRRWVAIASRIIQITLVGYLGIILVLLFFENRMVFVPSSPAQFWQDPPVPGWQDLYLTIEDGTRIHAWWCPRPGAEGALLYCHGNGGNLSHRGNTIRGLQEQLNVSVLIFDYPGYGKSEGSPTEAGCYAAGTTAYQFLREQQHVPGDKIFLFGNSLGGGVATYLAVREPHRALILSKTFTSLPDVGQHCYPWLPVRWLMRNRFDSLSRIKDCKMPVFLTHGTEDELIPYCQGVALHEAANEPKRFLTVHGGDHNAPMNQEFFTALKEFLAEVEAAPVGK